MSITYMVSNSDEQVLLSHKMAEDSVNMLLWGGFWKEQSYEDWLASKSEDELQKYREEGFNFKTINFIHSGDLTELF